MQEKLKILIVDDNDPVREIMVAILEHHGFEVVDASDGHTALQLAHEKRFDAVVCDSLMPGMSGAEVVTRLRSEPATATIPIIVSSGRGDALTTWVAPSASTHYLPKPFTPDEFVAKVEGVLAATCNGSQSQR